MTGIRKRAPTNKEFKNNFQGLASTRVKKGHLTGKEKKPEDNAKEVGVLTRINRAKLYENGWEVKVGTGNDAVTYNCSYGDGVMYIPDSTVTKQYFVPKGKVEVEVTIDKKSKIYTITKINTDNKKAVAVYENLLTLAISTDENDDVDASIQLSKTGVNIKSNNVVITNSDNEEIDLVESQSKIEESQKKIKTLEENVETLSETKENLETEVSSLKQKIKEIEIRLNDDTEDEDKDENNEGE